MLLILSGYIYEEYCASETQLQGVGIVLEKIQPKRKAKTLQQRPSLFLLLDYFAFTVHLPFASALTPLRASCL
ncbi:hypothetical protein FKM82_001055 [Ascaphus truei]